MLNRRILRAKAMQHIYAYKQCQRSNYELAFDYVRASFQPDLNSMEVQDKSKLAKDEEETSQLLKAYLDKGEDYSAAPAYVVKVIQEALTQYENQCRRDRNYLLQQMVTSTEHIMDHYLLLLLLLPAFAEESGRERTKKVNLLNPGAPVVPVSVPKANFYRNRVVQAIENNTLLQAEARKKDLHWNNYRSEIRQWFKNLLKDDEKFVAYQQLEQPSLEDDIEIAKHIFNQVIFKHESVTAIIEENDINWAENKKSIKSMISKSVKSVTETEPDFIELVELTPNWEEDKEFFKDLYNITLRQDTEYEHLISEKSKNWASDRMASLDSIIIKMAIVEMVNFSSIPVKVTINEYIDISKQYSTHKSKQFVNGMLDVIANDLQNKNLIRKSGRGLIDNQ